MNETVFTSKAKGERHTQDSDQQFALHWISPQYEPYFKAESHNSSWANPMLTKHQLVIIELEWPIEASSQEAAGLPRESCQEGRRSQNRPSHLCLLGRVLTATPAFKSPPKQDKQRKGRLKVIIIVTDREQMY